MFPVSSARKGENGLFEGLKGRLKGEKPYNVNNFGGKYKKVPKNAREKVDIPKAG